MLDKLNGQFSLYDLSSKTPLFQYKLIPVRNMVDLLRLHTWNFSFPISSSCVNQSSLVLLHAIIVFKHNFLRESVSVVWCVSWMWVLSSLRFNIWNIVAPKKKETPSRNILTVFQLSWDGRTGNKKSAFVNQWNFHNVLVIWIGYINAHVRER